MMSPVANPFVVMALRRHLASPNAPGKPVVHHNPTFTAQTLRHPDVRSPRTLGHLDASIERRNAPSPEGPFQPEGAFHLEGPYHPIGPRHADNAAAQASSLDRAGAKKSSTYRRNVRFLVAKQQPHIRSTPRCCPSLS